MARGKFQTLTEQMFYILLCLRQERCGTEIVRYVDDATAGRVPLGPGTLYTILAKFQEEGLIREARDYIGHSQTYLPETDGNMAFSVGQRVKHILFGSGTVLDVDMDKGAHVVQFDEMETPRKISFRAKLERI